MQKLNINNNRIGDEGIKDLADVLADKGCAIKILNVRKNNITNEGIDYLLKKLQVNGVFDYYFLFFLISSHKLIIIKCAQTNTALEELHVENNCISIISADCLLHLPPRIKLFLNENPLQFPPTYLARKPKDLGLFIEDLKRGANPPKRFRVSSVGHGGAGKTTLTHRVFLGKHDSPSGWKFSVP